LKILHQSDVYALAHQGITLFDTLDHGRSYKLSRLISLPTKGDGAGSAVEQVLETMEVHEVDDASNIRSGSSARRIEFVVSADVMRYRLNMTHMRV
jgi:hypothetical protein